MTTAVALHRAPSDWTFSPHFLWRRGALPFHDLLALVPRETWTILDQMNAIRAARQSLGGDLVMCLDRSVPLMPPQARRALLELKRDIYNDRHPRDRLIETAIAALDVAAGQRLTRWRAAWDHETELLDQARRRFEVELLTARKALAALVGVESFRRGTQLSSRNVRRSLQALAESAPEAETDRLRKARDTAVSFLFRMALKPSPFGSFTEVGAHPWVDMAKPGAPPGDIQDRVSHVRLSRRLLNWMERQVCALEECREHLPLRLNNTLRRIGHHFEFFTRGEDGTNQMYGGERFVRLPVSSSLSVICDVLEHEEVSRSELARRLATLGVPAEDARAFLERLVEIVFLERGLGVADQEPFYLERMATSLARVPGARTAQCAAALRALARIETVFPGTPARAREGLFEEIQRQLESFTTAAGIPACPDDAAAAHVFEDIAASGTASSWAPDLLQREQPSLGLLQQFLPLVDSATIERVGLYEYVTSVYGPEATVDLLDLYRGFAKLDRRTVTAVMSGTCSPDALQIRKVARLFYEHLASRVKDCAPTLDLDPDWLRGLLQAVPGGVAPWTSTTFRLQFFEEEDGTRGIVVNGVGPGHGARFSRFCTFLDGNEDSWSLRRSVEQEIRRRDRGIQQADLTAVFGVNTNLHPPLTDLTVEYPRARAVEHHAAVLHLTELAVSVDAKRKCLGLFRKTDGRPVRLVPLSFLFPIAGPSLYRFLFLLSPFVNVHGGLWEQLLAFQCASPSAMSRLPRLSLGGLVLDRRTWRYPLEALPHPKASSAHSPAGLLTADRFWRQLGIPRECFYRLRAADALATEPTEWTDELKRWVAQLRQARRFKPHYVDFRNPYLASVLWKRLTSERRGTVTFTECLPSTATYLRSGAGPFSAEEYVVELNHEGKA